MVQTRSAAKKAESDLKTDADQILHTIKLTQENGTPPPAKKPRREGSGPSKRRMRGKPSELCQLNFDVLFLIAAYIHPLDLLNLARTCRSFRELLMDRASTFIWKFARQQCKGLPACPTDLTEPEYANLVFYARCHGCGKHATTILWKVRRRYCPGCRIRHLRRLSSCNEVVRKNTVLPVEYITVKKESTERVARDQAAAFMEEYRQSSDKEQFISRKKEQCRAIVLHAKECEAWQKQRDIERQHDQKTRRHERYQSIFERLGQHGYQREIDHFGYYQIQQSRFSDFRTSKVLTDKEWERMWPGWMEIMDNFRLQRIDAVVYEPRRRSLESAYNQYVTHPSPDAPTFDLLPHVSDLARLPPFMDIVKAPEETLVDNKSFGSAFAQLPALVSEWRKLIILELAEAVEIPLYLSSDNATNRRRTMVSKGATVSSSAGLGRLQLACAMFRPRGIGIGACTLSEVFSVSMLYYCGFTLTRQNDDSRHSGSFLGPLGIQFLEEAPHIVHACGLDPSVATVDDMDHRNARLKCLACEKYSLVMNWRQAMSHASSSHQQFHMLPPLSKSPRWQLVGDEHISVIQSVEQSLSLKSNHLTRFVRCLLCRPCVGDAKSRSEVLHHLRHMHDLQTEGVEGVHFVPIGVSDPLPTGIEMVEEGDQISFRVPTK